MFSLSFVNWETQNGEYVSCAGSLADFNILAFHCQESGEVANCTSVPHGYSMTSVCIKFICQNPNAIGTSSGDGLFSGYLMTMR